MVILSMICKRYWKQQVPPRRAQEQLWQFSLMNCNM